MPRPTKWRKVCYMPRNTVFGPMDKEAGLEPINMTVDEYETIRLIDLEGLTQEECAEGMNVAPNHCTKNIHKCAQKAGTVFG